MLHCVNSHFNDCKTQNLSVYMTDRRATDEDDQEGAQHTPGAH